MRSATVRQFTSVAAVVALWGAPALAGGVDASRQQIDALFERGNYLEFGATGIFPDVAGYDKNNVSSRNIAKFFSLLTFAYKHDFNEKFSFAVIGDQPWGATVDYTDGTYKGVTASVNSYALTGLLRYKIDDYFSVYGGPRLEGLSFSVTGTPASRYTFDTQGYNWALGYTVGTAYENRGQRVSLTFNSPIRHQFRAIESGGTNDMTQDMPMSVNLNSQVPISRDMIMFGGVRWVNWKGFKVQPPLYYRMTGTPLVTLTEDTFTYSLGLGKKFNDTWSGAVFLSYEPETSKPISLLTPVNGTKTIGVAVTRTMQNNASLTFAANYTDLGGLGSTSDIIRFPGGHLIGASLKYAVRW